MTNQVNDDSTDVMLDSDMFNFGIEVNLIESEDAFKPIAYEKLPRTICNEIDDIASELLDPDKGRVAIIGSSQTGKSFLINQVVGNISRYLHKVNIKSMVFIRLKAKDVAQINSIPGLYGAYISALCEEFECAEKNICFVTEDTNVASYIYEATNKARIILEVSHSTFVQIVEMENKGATKIWASWRFIDANEILLKKKDLVALLELTLSQKMQETFKIVADKRLINSFVNYSIKQMPELLSEEPETAGLIMAPMGIWAVAIRRLCGILGLSEDPEIRNGNKIVVGKVIESVFHDNVNMFEAFVDDEDDDEHMIAVLPSGQVVQLKAQKSENEDSEVADVTPLEFNNMETLSKELHKEIIGQDEAIESLVDGMIVPSAGLHDSTKPIRSFLFLGPTGVGKTKLATTLAEHAAEKPMNVIRIDMSEYGSAHEAAKLIGSPPGYTGFEKGGILTSAVAKNPHSLVLLDEIEKADPKIWDSFLQILDAGRMTDGQGRTVDFTQTIVVMTSNLGASDLTRTSSGFSSVSEDAQYAIRQQNSKSIVMKAVESNLRPEMINRIDEIVIFKELSQETSRKIVRKELTILSDRMSNTGFILAPVSDDIVDDILAKSNVTKYGARDIQRVILKNVSNPVAKAVVARKTKKNKTITLSFDGDKNITVDKD